MSLDPPPPVQWGIVIGLLIGIVIILFLMTWDLADIQDSLDKVLRQGGGG